MTLIDGKATATAIKAEIAEEEAALHASDYLRLMELEEEKAETMDKSLTLIRLIPLKTIQERKKRGKIRQYLNQDLTK